MKSKIYINSTTQPQFSSLDMLHMKDKVETKLARLQNMGIVTPMKWPEWTDPMVLVINRNSNIEFVEIIK